ncbi:response regulator of citrate/malate metabolism [Nakamurella sp. UYEF19]|uniref:response regulator n=1 Tax=Nakamurella sp. UYEF19 TaxID=1756392 RepID=UPI0033968043
MIRTLVVDDDFQVARIHAASVERVPGFAFIGQAHSAADAAAAVRRDRPDLMILDIYLPDLDGLALLRELASEGDAPDTIFITAARDITTVRSAMGLGAFYYLVKPFGFPALQQQLHAYQQWREHLDAEIGQFADQEAVDSLFALLRPNNASRATQKNLPVTMAAVLESVSTSTTPMGASEVARTLGMSRPTAQRYLSELERRHLLRLELSYGSTGRPVHRYRRVERPGSRP